MGESAVNFLQDALTFWNEKYAEVVSMLTTTPTGFQDGTLWSVVRNVYNAISAIGLALVVLCWVVGVVKSVGTLTELKRPEVSVKVIVRLIIVQYVVTHALSIMMQFIKLANDIIKAVSDATGTSTTMNLTVPQEIIHATSSLGWINAIGPWCLSLVCMLLIIAMSFIILLTVYGRFFKIFIYTAAAPISLAGFAGEPTSGMGKSFVRAYLSVLMEGVVIVLACAVYTAFAKSVPTVDADAGASTMILKYTAQLAFQMLILVATVRGCDHMARELTGL
jgi:hypothetical protein